MIGLHSSSKEQIGQYIETLFDKIAISVMGDIPKLKYKRLTIHTHPGPELSNLFVQSIQNIYPNILEQDALKGMLESSYSYIEALKNKTKANIVEKIDGLIKESKVKRAKLLESNINYLIEEELGKAKRHLRTIIETESNKIRNIGKGMHIAKISSINGDKDPKVFFVCIHDDKLCSECERLHLEEDKITPKVWKLSELSYVYHKKGNNTPSILGLHPNERCVLEYLPIGFGFDSKGALEKK